jgi:hypothetical protein
MTTDAMSWDWTRAIFDHVQLRVSDLGQTRAFCAAFLLDPDGNNIEAVHRPPKG